MTKIRIIGVAILVVGVALLGVVYHATNAPLGQLSEPFSVRYSNQMMWYIALGLAAAIGGGLLVVMGNEGSISHPGARGRDPREPARGRATRYLNVARLAEHKTEADSQDRAGRAA